jgi:hypothetical protein
VSDGGHEAPDRLWEPPPREWLGAAVGGCNAWTPPDCPYCGAGDCGVLGDPDPGLCTGLDPVVVEAETGPWASAMAITAAARPPPVAIPPVTWVTRRWPRSRSATRACWEWFMASASAGFRGKPWTLMRVL